MIINFSDEEHIYNKNSIFLAGPTTRNGLFSDSWRKSACDYLEHELHYDGVVYVPEFQNSRASVELTKQAPWERQGLMEAGAIVFYLCRKFPEMPGLTTNAEFGRYFALRPQNVLICSPVWANKNDYLVWQYKEESDMPVYETLEDILKAAVDMAHRYDAGLL